MKSASDKKYDINDILLLLACILTDHETVKEFVLRWCHVILQSLVEVIIV